MFGILLAIHILITILLLVIILIQKSEGGSSLFASGSGNSMFSARGTSNMLTKTTWVLASVFLLNCILMAHIAAVNVKNATSIITGKVKVTPVDPIERKPIPAKPADKKIEKNEQRSVKNEKKTAKNEKAKTGAEAKSEKK